MLTGADRCLDNFFIAFRRLPVFSSTSGILVNAVLLERAFLFNWKRLAGREKSSVGWTDCCWFRCKIISKKKEREKNCSYRFIFISFYNYNLKVMKERKKGLLIENWLRGNDDDVKRC